MFLARVRAGRKVPMRALGIQQPIRANGANSNGVFILRCRGMLPILVMVSRKAASPRKGHSPSTSSSSET